MICTTTNCGRGGTVWISKGGVAKRVCQKCADELVATQGYVYATR